MLIGGVVDDQLGDDAKPSTVSVPQKIAEVVHGAVTRIHGRVVGDVVAVVPQRRRIEGKQPDRGDAEVLEVVELLSQAAEVADLVGVAVVERPDMGLINDRAFYDSNADGIGDFRGLAQKLDYLQDLGVTAVWLLPFYPSPLRDDGYDIAHYTAVNPSYGTMNDFRNFLRDAHSRGLRVITELVINHTSDQHPWFQKSRASKPGSAW